MRSEELPIRADLRGAHEAVLEQLRRPGCWFTGEERLAIAAESRHAPACPLCIARKDALSPEHPGGEHTRASDVRLPGPVVEIAHRVRTDSGRLSRAWFERTLAAGIEVGAYVEAVGVVALLAGVDFTHRALGVAPPPLPAPAPGAPSRHTPSGLREGIAWVPMLAPEDARGPEADLYDAAPMIPNIARALSAVPDHVRTLQSVMRTHYLSVAQIPDPTARRVIDRTQMELVAARVSALNECFY